MLVLVYDGKEFFTSFTCLWYVPGIPINLQVIGHLLLTCIELNTNALLEESEIVVVFRTGVGASVIYTHILPIPIRP